MPNNTGFLPTLTIIRGLPGSGKTTLAEALQDATHANHYEADQFFVDEDGIYRYDKDKIGQAHVWCFEKVEESLKKGYSAIVSNTFTRIWEMENYLELAKEMGYHLQVIEVKGPWLSVHNVPAASMEKMRDRWEEYHD